MYFSTAVCIQYTLPVCTHTGYSASIWILLPVSISILAVVYFNGLRAPPVASTEINLGHVPKDFGVNGWILTPENADTRTVTRTAQECTRCSVHVYCEDVAVRGTEFLSLQPRLLCKYSSTKKISYQVDMMVDTTMFRSKLKCVRCRKSPRTNRGSINRYNHGVTDCTGIVFYEVMLIQQDLPE